MVRYSAMKAASRVLLALRLLGVATCLMFLLSVFTPLWNVLAQRLAVEPVIQPAEAIVVLGAGGDEGDEYLNDASLSRAATAMKLYGRGLAPILVLCGVEGEVDVRNRMAL